MSPTSHAADPADDRRLGVPGHGPDQSRRGAGGEDHGAAPVQFCGPHKESVEASIKKYSPRPEEEAVPVSAAPAANPWVTG